MLLKRAYDEKESQTLSWRRRSSNSDWDYRNFPRKSVPMSLAAFLAGWNLCEIMETHYADSFNAYTSEKVPILALVKILATFSQRLSKRWSADFGNWNTPWGEIQPIPAIDWKRIDLKLMTASLYIPVGLAFETWELWLAMAQEVRKMPKANFMAIRGNSFVAWFSRVWREKVKLRVCWQVVQSAEILIRPHFYDQLQRYAECQLQKK